MRTAHQEVTRFCYQPSRSIPRSLPRAQQSGRRSPPRSQLDRRVLQVPKLGTPAQRSPPRERDVHSFPDPFVCVCVPCTDMYILYSYGCVQTFACRSGQTGACIFSTDEVAFLNARMMHTTHLFLQPLLGFVSKLRRPSPGKPQRQPPWVRLQVPRAARCLGPASQFGPERKAADCTLG